MNEKTKQFEKEYKELMKKHNVILVVDKWSDEFGAHTTICYKERSTYCNISYTPEKKIINSGYQGMGQ